LECGCSGEYCSIDTSEVVVLSRLTEEEEIQKRWKNFCNKILKYELDFGDVVRVIIRFTAPPFELAIQGDEFLKKWSGKDKKYI